MEKFHDRHRSRRCDDGCHGISSLAAVAKVGTQEFNNLQDAINSAGESPVVIDLEENVSLTDGLVIGAGKDVTIQCGTSDPKTIKMEGKESTQKELMMLQPKVGIPVG